MKKQIQEEFNQGWTSFFKNISDKNMNSLEISKTESFFKDKLIFDLNKIHVFRGDNGQGKSTLLNNILKATTLNVDISKNLKLGSNNKEIGYSMNRYSFSPYRPIDGFSKEDSNMSNCKNNITIYTDFSIEFYKNQEEDMHSIIQNYDRHSNGERKISGINDIFSILKVLKTMKEIKDYLNIFVIMDEPESGLSISIQEEFRKKLIFYINKMHPKINLTFFISSHSFVWEKSHKLIEVYEIKDFKKEEKKVHRRVFV
jgi:predicted ATPase